MELERIPLSHYSNKKRPACLCEGDEFTFSLDGGNRKYDYIVETDEGRIYAKNITHIGMNDEIFIVLGLDQLQFCEKYHPVDGGIWPYSPDMKKLTNVVNALYDEIEKKERKTSRYTFEFKTYPHWLAYDIYKDRLQDKQYYSPSNFSSSTSKLSFFKKAMSALQSVPERLKRFLNTNFHAFYRMGWVDEDLNMTESGEEALTEFLFTKHEDEFGKYAESKIAEIEKKEQKEK